MSILKTVNLTKNFGKVTALDNVNLEVKEGEIFGFIGPNGAGKTTTIRILLGIIKPTKGEAYVFDKDAWKDAVEIHKKIAYVPGEANLWPNLTGGEIIDLFAKLHGKSNKTKKEKLIKMFDFDPSKKFRTYSKGNRQKVMLIAAFASDADLYILDEPTSGLDPLMEEVFVECVIEKKNENKGIFLSSHILSEVEKLCNKVGIINKGKLIETGTLDELRHLTRINMNIKTTKQVVGLEDIKEIHNIEKNNHDNELSFQVDSSRISDIVNHIAKFNVIKLESTPPTLEDLFMSYYNKKEVEDHV